MVNSAPPQEILSPQMIPVGYMAKKIAARPQFLKAGTVRDIYSLCGCISPYFCDFTDYWEHNSYSLFDDPETILDVARAALVDLSQCSLFFYEVYHKELDRHSSRWGPVAHDLGLPTAVELLSEKRLEGFDVTAGRRMADHSPLSCNSLAETIPVNEHCLLTSLAEAVRLAETGAFANSEPGALRIYAVYTCPLPEC
jgi:hypothetical protein